MTKYVITQTEYDEEGNAIIISTEFGSQVDAYQYATDYGIDFEAIEQKEVEDLPSNTLLIVTAKIRAARAEFIQLAAEVAAENVLMGITAAGKTKLIADTLSNVFLYGSTGSLYEVLNELERLEITEEMAPFITADRVAQFKEKVQAVIDNL